MRCILLYFTANGSGLSAAERLMIVEKIPLNFKIKFSFLVIHSNSGCDVRFEISQNSQLRGDNWMLLAHRP